MSAVAIVEAYSKRWAIEPLFAALKLSDGMGAMWQRGRTALLRWLHLVLIGRALLVLLTARAEPQTLALVRVGGWRKAATLTPGLVKDALAHRFRDFEAFRLVPTKRAKSGPVRGIGPPSLPPQHEHRELPSQTASNRCEQPEQTAAVGKAQPGELETPVRTAMGDGYVTVWTLAASRGRPPSRTLSA